MTDTDKLKLGDTTDRTQEPTHPSASNSMPLYPSSPNKDKVLKMHGEVGNQAVGNMVAAAGDTGVPRQFKRNVALPEDLQRNLESSLGQDFSEVAVEKNSEAAEKMDAVAYTQGDSVHFAPGHFNPGNESGKHLIGHEFTHVAQQRSGVVNPTGVLGKGIAVNDSQGLEREADELGKQAVSGKPASNYRSAGLGLRNGARVMQSKNRPIQLAKHPSRSGDWYDDKFNISNSGGQHSVEMDLKFDPGHLVNAELIGITQTVRSIKSKKPYYINNSKLIKDRSIKSGDAITIDPVSKETDEGTHIDQAKHNRNPLYAVEGAPKTDSNLYDTLPVKGDVTKRNTWGRHGFRFMQGKTLKKQEALLHDKTGLNLASKDSGQIFETTALAIKGIQKDTYYGSVEWGWRTDSKGNFSKIPFKVVHEGMPSSTFLKSAEIWNASKTSKGESTLNLPTVDVKIATAPITGQYPSGFIGPPLQIPAGTRVQVLRNAVPPGTNGEIKVVDGVFTDNILQVAPTDMANLRDERP